MSTSWTPSSWQGKPNPFNITYNDELEARKIEEKITQLPPLVTELEVLKLKKLLKDVARGNAFVWQGGDCAELFAYCNEKMTSSRIALLSELGQEFTQNTGVPSVLIGRMAGQYGKPRNTLTEVVNGVELLKFYGDMINDSDPRNRQPDPRRMLDAYFYSSATLNRMRAAAGANAPLFSATNDLSGSGSENLQTPFIFTGHEGLFLHYEQAVTKPWRIKLAHRQEDNETAYYNSSAHFVWIGDKTRQLDGAHTEYFRGIQNPIGIKLGPTTKPKELVELLDIVDPEKETGKVTLITRFGSLFVKEMLGPLIQAVQESGHVVVWQCDPMHGNTRTTSAGIRTRSMSHVISELKSTMAIHKQKGSWLGGIHLEMTPDEVVECTGGSGGWCDADLGHAYHTKCDPRLNKEQVMEVVATVADYFVYLKNASFRCRL